MVDKRYNGWSNYETWVVKLWLDNEYSMYRYWTRTAQECWDAVRPDNDGERVQAEDNLSDRLKEEITESAPQLEGVFADLLDAALCEVNWREIAASYLEEVDTDTEPESHN